MFLPTVRLAAGGGEAEVPGLGRVRLMMTTQTPRGAYSLTLGFEGNIGAEVACITSDGVSVTESASLPPIQLGPQRPRIPVRH